MIWQNIAFGNKKFPPRLKRMNIAALCPHFDHEIQFIIYLLVINNLAATVIT